MRRVVGVIGVAYLVIGVPAFAVPRMFGLIPHGYNIVFDNLIHLTPGGCSASPSGSSFRRSAWSEMATAPEPPQASRWIMASALGEGHLDGQALAAAHQHPPAGWTLDGARQPHP